MFENDYEVLDVTLWSIKAVGYVLLPVQVPLKLAEVSPSLAVSEPLLRKVFLDEEKSKSSRQKIPEVLPSCQARLIVFWDIPLINNTLFHEIPALINGLNL
jgi:hypothetical protein